MLAELPGQDVYRIGQDIDAGDYLALYAVTGDGFKLAGAAAAALQNPSPVDTHAYKEATANFGFAGAARGASLGQGPGRTSVPTQSGAGTCGSNVLLSAHRARAILATAWPISGRRGGKVDQELLLIAGCCHRGAGRHPGASSGTHKHRSTVPPTPGCGCARVGGHLSG